jgi:hypothetical protein
MRNWFDMVGTYPSKLDAEAPKERGLNNESWMISPTNSNHESWGYKIGIFHGI